MAGQPPEPTFQPSGQDNGVTQGRPAWQPSSYTPPGGGSPGGQQGYSAPGYGAQDQAYAAPPPPDQSYAGHDQTYTNLGQGQAPGQGQDYQNYQGYQPPNYAAQQGQGAPTPPPQWQMAPPPVQARAKHPGERGFVGSLFDFSFSSFVTPKIIKVLYVLVTIWTGLIGITILIYGFKLGGLAGGLFTLIIVEPLFLLLTLGIYRVILEAFMVVFRMYEEMKKIRENTGNQNAANQNVGN